MATSPATTGAPTRAQDSTVNATDGLALIRHRAGLIAAIDEEVTRLGRIQALADHLARSDDSKHGEAWRGIVDALDQCVWRFDAILHPAKEVRS